MINATFHSDTYTVPGTNRVVNLYWLFCSYKDIVLRSISGSVRDSGYYGINGTFFSPGASPVLDGVAINDGAVIANYGAVNRSGNPIPCGTFFALKQTVGSVFLGTSDISVYNGSSYEGITLTTANTQFAVGGASLYPAESLDYSTYDSRVRIQHDRHMSQVARSAILYVGGGQNDRNTILLTVQGNDNASLSSGNNHVTNPYGVSLWELRTLINTKFSSYISAAADHVVHAIALDGGHSCQLAYKNSSGQTISYQSAYLDGVIKGGNNPVHSMLCVPM